MYATFTVSVACFLMTSFSVEAVPKQTSEEKFAKWVAKQGNKSYSDKKEWNARLANFEHSDAIIEKYNWQAEASHDKDAVKLKHNFSSDLTNEEFASHLGKKQVSGDDELSKARKRPGRKTRNLQTAPEDAVYTSIDHTYVAGVAGKMGPVRDQGACGSCAAFASVMSMEGRYAIFNNTVAPAWSTQQALDCAKYPVTWNESCNGGWGWRYYTYFLNNGSALEAEYPYKAQDQSCDNSIRPMANNLVDWGIASVSSDATGALETIAALQDGPLDVSIQVPTSGGSCYDAFRFYYSGIITKNSCPVTEYPVRNYIPLNHEIVLVGYVEDPAQANNPIDDSFTEVTTMTTVNSCYRASGKERKRGVCNNSTFTLTNRQCCRKEEREVTEQIANPDGSPKYAGGHFILQNSWGTDWGDNGFFRVAVEYDYGVLNMNGESVWPIMG